VDARPRPQPDALSEEFWAAAREGRLLIQRCAGCGVHQWYPRAVCVRCGGEPTWVEAGGRGVVHTFTIVHRSTNPEFAPDTPYVFAIVALEEGVRMTTRIVDVPLEDVRCDLPVRVVFPPGADETPLPCFTGG
jgi:uncharacterized OB-fold protein